MRRAWIVAALLVGVVGAAAWEVRPARWAAEQLGSQVARQMAAGDVSALMREAAPALAPSLNGHLQAAIAPLQGDQVREVRLLRCGSGAAEATVRYADGRTADVRMVSGNGGRWLVSSLT